MPDARAGTVAGTGSFGCEDERMNQPVTDPRAVSEYRIAATALRAGDLVNTSPGGEDDWQQVLSVHTAELPGDDAEAAGLVAEIGDRYVVVRLTDVAPVDSPVYFDEGVALAFGMDGARTARSPTRCPSATRCGRSCTPGSSWLPSAPEPGAVPVPGTGAGRYPVLVGVAVLDRAVGAGPAGGGAARAVPALVAWRGRPDLVRRAAEHDPPPSPTIGIRGNFVANIKSQIKRIRTNEAARLRNKSVKSSLKTAIRSFREAAEAGDKDKAARPPSPRRPASWTRP